MVNPSIGVPVDAAPNAPALVRLVRGGIVETQHRGDLAIVGEGGALRASLGSPDRLISLRSSVKPFTAVAVLLAVGAAGGSMSSEALALSSASHAGADEHVAVAQGMVDTYGLDPSLLVHGRPSPLRSGTSGELLRHMCSGQHLSLLLLAQSIGVEGRGYDSYDHPVQLRIRAVVGELLGLDLNAAPWGMDGCAIPTYGVPLRAAAEGARRWANPASSGLRPELLAALTHVRDAVIAHPRLIAGGGFLDTDLIRGGEGSVVAKQGAEGLCLVGAPGIGIALHTEDGDGAARAGRVATVAALRAAGAAVASASSLDLHRYVEYPDPRGGAPLARVEPTAALANLALS